MPPAAPWLDLRGFVAKHEEQVARLRQGTLEQERELMINVTLPPDSASQWSITTIPATTEYQHDWLALMPPDALAQTAVSIFLDWKRTREALGYLHPSSDEELDACQQAWDALRDLAGVVRAYDMIYNAPDMSDELYDEFMEVMQ